MNKQKVKYVHILKGGRKKRFQFPGSPPIDKKANGYQGYR